MSCNCHGKSGVSVTRTSPFDQCSACAKKHAVKAWNLFNEFTYADDNRDVISGQLRLAAEQLLSTPLPVAEVAERLGYRDPYHFSRRFKNFAGVSPERYRREFPGSHR